MPHGGGAVKRRRGLGVVTAAVVVVAAVGAAPSAWRANDGASDGKPKPPPAALTGPAGTEPAADFDDDGVQDVYAAGESGGAVSVVYGSKGRDQGGDEKDGDTGSWTTCSTTPESPFSANSKK
jgi:hypothetical protein